MLQLKAGYFTSAIETLKANGFMKDKVEPLLEQLSYFDLETNINMTDESSDAAVAVLYNIVSRGTPAYASQFVEDILSTTIGKTMKRISPEGGIYREMPKREVQDLVFKALHIIEPRIKAKRIKSTDPRLEMIYDFLTYGAVFSQGDYIFQFANIDCDFQSIVKNSKKLRRDIEALKANPSYTFLNEKCDLNFSAPYAENSSLTLTYKFNTDDSMVDTTDWITEDAVSALLNPLGIDGRVVIRKMDILSHKTDELSFFTQSPYFDIIRENYNTPLYNTEDGIEALQIALTPFAIARIQKVLLEAVNSGALPLDAKSWKIGVIERDVPCAFLAVEDLKQHFNKFFTLENLGRVFPNVKLDIYFSDEFASTELNLLYQGSRENISEFDSQKEYDLLIDISVLARSGFDEKIVETKAKKYALIRSAKLPVAETKLLFNNYIYYDINLPLRKETSADDEDSSDEEDEDTSPEAEKSFEQEEALKFFLKNIFGKNSFLDYQAQSIAYLLNGENVLHVSPPATGKTLIALFAALMKPGYSFVLSPTLAVMDMQFNMLRERRIETDYYVNPALQNSYDRDLAVGDIVSGKSIVTFLSPSLVHDPYIRDIFKRIDSRKIPVYFVMVDEAQRVCLQTFDFRSYYQDIKNIIAGNFSDENINILRTGAFTWTKEANIINEISQKLQTERVVISDEPAGKVSLFVHEVQLKGAGNTDDLGAYARKVKQAEAERIISNAKNPTAVIFSEKCPFDDKDYKISGLETGYYAGDIVELDRDITSSEAVSGMKACEKFISGETSVLAAAQSAGTGIRVKKLTNVIYFEPPVSLDAFCRMNLRGAKDKTVTADLFINTVDRNFSGFETVRDSSGSMKTVENESVTDFDTVTNLQRLQSQNPGPDKEKAVIKEILDGVVFPRYSFRQTIIDAVYNEFNIDIQIDAEPSFNPYQLYIYSSDKTKSLGFINFKTGGLNMPEMSYDKTIAEKIQTYIFDLIKLNTENPLVFLSVMENENEAEEGNGIQTALDLVEEGGKTSVVIPFYNNSFFEAAQFLNTILKTDITTTALRRCYNQSRSYEAFEKLLAKLYNVRVKNLGEGKRTEFQAFYERFRNRRDTLRAISRLKEIDLIDDYLINSAKEETEVFMTKHNKDFYRMKLLPVLQRNLTKEKVLLYLSDIDEEKYLLIEKYAGVLIDFFYAEVYPLYERAAKDSGNFFKRVLQEQKDGSFSEEVFSKNLQNYFVSRYKCGYLFEDEEEAFPKDVDGIIKAVSKTDGNINELLSLQASVDSHDILRRGFADKIVYGYCRLFTLSQFDREGRYEAYQTISEGLDKLRHTEKTEQFVEDFNKLTKKISEENFDLKDESECILSMKLQLNWLKKFNAGVLKTREVL
ncbi:MAG: DEAD/DEAH box helicase [Bacteroidales bacterium]|nr:DEAD/DEAH box helicase [Bacteroidales bacterium]